MADGVAHTKRELLERGRLLRGVPVSELEARLARAQELMAKAELDVMLVTTEEDFFYFTGLLSRFWNSPTRPFYLAIPRAGGRPKAVVPSIMTSVLQKYTFLEPRDIFDWPAPREDDDGVTLIASLLGRLPEGEERFGRVGLMMGHESTIRMPLASIDRMRKILAQDGSVCIDSSRLVRELRMMKSAFEVQRVRHACDIASAAFDFFPARLEQLSNTKSRGEGVTEREARFELRSLLLEFGADDTPYVMAQSGNNGYDNIILEPTDKALRNGDVLVIDTGMCFEGYWCDFDRNFVVGGEEYLSDACKGAHDLLWLATNSGFEVCMKHGTSSDIFREMSATLGIDPKTNSTGRVGHGLGLQLTEHWSNNSTDETPLRPGMVVTLEPGMLVVPDGDKMIVHEEDVLITSNGAEWLSKRAPRQMVPIFLGNISPDIQEHILNSSSYSSGSSAVGGKAHPQSAPTSHEPPNSRL
jgi:Xaa-Pro aminopeptidase